MMLPGGGTLAPRTDGRAVILAFDVGTTTTKAGYVALDGTPVALARAEYALHVDAASGRAEQDPDDWWRALVRTSADLAARVPDADVVAVALDGHGPTLVALDDDGRPTRAAITWLDSRARSEQDELAAATGLRGWALSVLPAALWLERHEPDVAAYTRWYLNTWEALALRLTGEAATTLVHGQPFPEPAVLAEAGLTVARIAPPIPAGEIVGGLTAEAAEALGLRRRTPVVAGMVDAFASFHGAGMTEPGDAIDAGGAAGGFGVYWGEPVDAPGAFRTPAPLPGRWVIGGAMAATGKALDWFRDGILGSTISLDALLAEAGRVAPGADGLVFLPYLAGERSPLWDPTARGVFAGLTLGHGRAHLARAILEAAALAIRHVADPIVDAGVSVRAMRVTGGPARSDAWNRIKADVTGFPVDVPHAHETAVVGSAIVAATAIGVYPDLPTAIRAMTRIERRIEPDPANRETYDRLYRAYVDLYPATVPIVRELARVDASAASPVVPVPAEAGR